MQKQTMNKWLEYEASKRRIAVEAESGLEYERRIRELVQRLKI